MFGCCLFICLPSFASVRSCAGLCHLFLGSRVTVVFVGVTCDEPSGNKQMAHSQIVVVIAISRAYGCCSCAPVRSICHWRFFNCRSPSFASICYRLLLLVLMWLRIRLCFAPSCFIVVCSTSPCFPYVGELKRFHSMSTGGLDVP